MNHTRPSCCLGNIFGISQDNIAFLCVFIILYAKFRQDISLVDFFCFFFLLNFLVKIRLKSRYYANYYARRKFIARSLFPHEESFQRQDQRFCVVQCEELFILEKLKKTGGRLEVNTAPGITENARRSS